MTVSRILRTECVGEFSQTRARSCIGNVTQRTEFVYLFFVRRRICRYKKILMFARDDGQWRGQEFSWGGDSPRGLEDGSPPVGIGAKPRRDLGGEVPLEAVTLQTDFACETTIKI